MFVTHNFAADERPEPSRAVQSRDQVLVAWALALLLFLVPASGFVADQIISCAAAVETERGPTCTPAARPDPSRQWRNPTSARWATPLHLRSIEDDLLEKADAR